MKVHALSKIRERLHWLVWACWLMAAQGAWAATITSTATGGNWNAGTSWLGGVAPATIDSAVIASGATVTTTATATIASLTVNSTAQLNLGGFNFTVSGASNVAGTLSHTSITGTKTFTGLLTINSGGTWDNPINEAVTFSGGISHNGATFNAGTGVYTFGTSAQTIGGSSALSIPNLTSNIILTNNGTLTVGAALSGTGTLINSASAILNIGGTSAITVLTATAVGNTVNYTGAAQTVKAATYHHLGLSGSGVKTLPAGLSTIAGNLDLSGTATATTAAALSIGGNLTVGVGTTFTSANFTNLVTGTTTVNGTLAHSGAAAKTYVGAVTINAGGIWTNAGNAPVTFRGGLTHNGATFTAGTGVYTFGTNAQTIDGSSAIAIPSVTVTGVTLTNNGTLTVATALGGSGGLSNSATATLNIGGTSTITTLTATVVGNTVNYTGAAQTVKATTYHHLGLSGSGTKTLTSVTTVNGDLTLSGTATATTAANFSIGGNLTVGAGTTFTSGNFTNLVTGSTTVNGTLAHSGAAAKTYVGAVTINAGDSWTNAGNAPVTFRGGLTHHGATFTAGSGVYTFDTNAQTIGGSSAIAIPSVTVTGVTLTNNGTLTVATALGGTGGLSNSATATLNLGGTSTITTLTAGAVGNTVNYTLAGAQTVRAINYYNLGASGSGIKSLAGATTVDGTLTLTVATLALGANTLTLNGPAIAGTPGNLTTTASSSLVFGGSSASVTVPSSVTALNNLTLNNSSGIALGASPTLNGALTLTSGNLTTGAFTLSLAAFCPGSYSRASGYIIGNLTLTFPLGATTCTYPVGDSIGYAPMDVTMAGVTVAGRLNGRVDAGDHPDTTASVSGIDAAKSANHYWTLTAGTPVITYTSYSATFQFCENTGSCTASEVDAGANPGNFIVVRKSSAGDWSTPSVGTRNSYSTPATGITSASGFGSFAVGEALLCFTDAFSGSLSGNWSVGNKSGGFTPAINAGRLRLTDTSSTGQATWATLQRVFPAAGNKATVEFEHFAYGNTTSFPGDGMGVIFSDASVAPVAGAFGGSMGYAQKSPPPGSDCASASGCPGFTGGWLGIALDEYGNFSTALEGRQGGGASLVTDSVALRGSGSGLAGYKFLQGTSTLTPGVDANNVPPGTVAHRYRIIIDHTDGIHTYVSVYRDATSGNGTAYTTLIAPFDVSASGYSQSTIPASFNLSFTGATGSNNNIHEVRNLSICTVQPLASPTLHHIEIDHNGSACTNSATPVTVKACADSNCTALYTGNVTVDLTPNASGSLTWAPTEPLAPLSGGSLAMTLTNTSAGTVVLGTATPATGTRCFNGATETCNLVFTACTVDAVESRTTSVAGTPIYTKLAGTAFNLDIVRTAGGNQTVSLIELVDARTGTGTCTNYSALPTTTPASTISPATAALSNGTPRATVAFTYNNAAPNVKVRMTTGGAVKSCSTDNFAIRPTGFTVTPTVTSGLSIGVAATQAGSSGAPAIVAGQDTFKLTATAVYGASTATAYVGTPVFDASTINKTLNYLGTVTIPAPFPAASAGVSEATGLTYNEVGNFGLNANPVWDYSFADVDSVNGECVTGFSNALDANGKYSCAFGSPAVTAIGRFVPHHFNTTVTQGCAAGSYTYAGQAFGLTVTAVNMAGDITQNYQGSSAFAKALTLSDANASAAGTLSPSSLAASGFTAGVASLTATYTFASANRQTAPTSIKLRALETAADGVNSSLGAEGSTTIRGGRVHLFNAYGSELLDLPMTMRAEYWNGAGWVQNTDDNCTGDTTLDASNAVSLVLTNPSALATCVWDSGNPGLSGVGCITAGSTSPLIDKRFRTGTAMAVTGSPSFLQKGDFNLWFKQPGVSGSITVTANVPAWLEYGWTSLTNADPVGRATFGLYKSPLIYRRENY